MNVIVQPPTDTLDPGDETGVTIEITGTPDQVVYPVQSLGWSNFGPDETIALALFKPTSVASLGKMKVVAQGGSGPAVGTLEVCMLVPPRLYDIGGPWGTPMVGTLIVPDGTCLGYGIYDVIMA